MLKWVQGNVSALTGSVEPIYGPEAFRSVSETVKGKNPFGEVTREDLEWRAPWSSHVETQTFYFTSKSGHYGFAQIIHSNPVGLMFTAQFTCRVTHDDIPEDNVWTSTALEDFEAKGTEFSAHDTYVSLNEKCDQYKINSKVNQESIVDFTITRQAAAFKIGADGTSLYGTDLDHPWGSMRHVFWPRAAVKGTIHINGKEIEIDGESMYVMAMQGMKPHHTAARWNFVNFQGPTTSVVVMEFTTPPSYGSCTVSIGGVTNNNKLLFTSADVKVHQLEPEVDEEVGWSVPTKIEFDLSGPEISAEKSDELVCSAQLTGETGKLVQRVDVMAEIPNFVKKVVAGLAHAKPYIYQFSNKKMKIKLTTADGKVIEELGHAFTETTFIS